MNVDSHTDEKINVDSSLNAKIELFTTNDLTTSDLKVFKAVTSRFSVFLRHRTSVDHDTDDVTSFFLSDFNYNLVPHIDAVFELQAGSNFGTIPRFGIQYLNTFDVFFCYLLYSYGPDDNTIELEHIFSYGLPLTEEWQFKPQVSMVMLK